MRKTFKRKSLSWLLVLAMILSLFSGMALQASAVASETLTIAVKDSTGAEKIVKTLTYDSTSKKYMDGQIDPGLVKDFTTQPGGCYAYTGINKKPDPRCLAVAKTGILFEDLITYTANALGVDASVLKGDTNIDCDGFASGTYDDVYGVTRYYYPEWYNAETYSATTGDEVGTVVPTVLAITGYHSAVYEVGVKTVADLLTTADEERAPRLLLGQKQGGDATEINLGNMSQYNVAKVTFTLTKTFAEAGISDDPTTPTTYTITVKGNPAEAMDTSSVRVWDAAYIPGKPTEYLTGTVSGDTVVFEVTPGTKYGVSANPCTDYYADASPSSFIVTKEDGSTVTTDTGGSNQVRFTMPESNVTVTRQYTAYEKVNFTIGDGTATVDGTNTDTVTLPIIVGESNVTFDQVYLNWDLSQAPGLTPISVAPGADAPANATVSSVGAQIPAMGIYKTMQLTAPAGEHLSGGELLKVTFEVAANAAAGTKTVMLQTAPNTTSLRERIDSSNFRAIARVGDMTPGTVTVNVVTPIPTGNPNADVWDGTLDFSWYDESNVKSEYHITKPAQWAALAWICSEHLGELSEIGADSYTAGNVTGITGTVPTAQNTFANVQFYLDNDIDMGGVYDSDTQTWSGPNYYPVGSGVANDKKDAIWYGTFLGSFDGQGHIVKNMYLDRYDNGSGVGGSGSQMGALFGRVGAADDATPYPEVNITIKNVAVTGYSHGYRSWGGVVGKTLHVANGYSVKIENCVNFATVLTSGGGKGTGGVVGALWNGATVNNCANFGKVTGGYRAANVAGVSGAAEGATSNSLNVGTVTNTATATNVGAVALNQSTANVTNCYALEGSTPGYTTSIVNGNTLISGGWKTADEMKTADFVTLLNTDNTGAWMFPQDGDAIGAVMTAAGVSGYPVPAVFASEPPIEGKNFSASSVEGAPGETVNVTFTVAMGDDFQWVKIPFSVTPSNAYVLVSDLDSIENVSWSTASTISDKFIATSLVFSPDGGNTVTSGTYTFTVPVHIADDAALGEEAILKPKVFGWANANGASENLYPGNYTIVDEGKITVKTDYTVELSAGAESATAGQTFTVDVIMTSDQVLSGGEIDLSYNPAVATVQSIQIADGLTNGNSNFNNTNGTAKISFYNNTASAANGLTVATITFNAVDEGTASISITAATATAAGNPDDQMVGFSSVATNVSVISPDTYSIAPYGGGKYLVLYQPANDIESGCATYNGNDMMWSGKYEAWAYLVDNNATLTSRDFGVNGDGTKDAVCYPEVDVEGYQAGDLNANTKVNIVDAQIAYDLASNIYGDFAKVDMLHWLMADVNGNKTVDSLDAFAIQYYIHYNTFVASQG